MATPLEGIVDISTKGGFSAKARDYNGESFRDAVTYMQDAHKIDITSKEGLGAYEKLTGEKLGGKVGEEADFYKSQGDKLREHGVMTYAKKHFGKMLGELDENALMSFALNYIPENPLNKPVDDEHVDPYEIAREAAYSAVKASKQIESNPGETLAEAMKDGKSIFSAYVAMDPKGYLEVAKGIAQERAVLAIGAYGAKKFITTTKSGLEKKAKERDSLVEKMEKDAKKSGKQLTASERADLIKSGNLGQYDDCSMVDSMYQNIIGPAIEGAMKKAAEKKKKEKEAAEKKSKKK